MSTNCLIRLITKAFTFIPIFTLLTFLIFTIHASDALALDTSFSGDGKVTTSFSAGNDVGSGIAVQFDDKIVVVGTSDDGSGTSEFAVVRFNVNGSLDTSFNGDGRVTTFFSAAADVGSGIAVQSDDKIVVVGTSDNGSGVSEFAVARFNIDGSLDTSFSDDGMVTTSFSAGDDVGAGIALQSDDKIIVVGTSDDGSGTSEFALARFNDDGSLDTSFSDDGMVTTFFSAGNDVGSGIAVQSDDKIIVVGSGDDLNGALEFVVARFKADGSFTDNFPFNAKSFGKETTSFSAGDDVGAGIAVQSDDKIVVVGTSDSGSGTSEFAVARYLPDLSFSFNGGGGDGGGGGGGCFIATAAYGSPKIGFVPTMLLMLLFGSGFIGFVRFKRKYKE